MTIELQTEPQALSAALVELQSIAQRMEALGPGELEEAVRLLGRASVLRTALETPLAALRILSSGIDPDSR